MTEAILWGALLRLLQSVSQAAPFILIGLVITAVFRSWLGHAGVRRLFGYGSWRSRRFGWILGMLLPVMIGLLLPVCSLGVIPIMREMRRSGLAPGAILAFGLTAPLFNPLSILYGLTLSEPFIILTFSLCAMLVATLIGLTYDCLFPEPVDDAPQSVPIPYGIKRIIAIFVSMGQELCSRSSLYILTGLSGVMLLNFLLAKGAFQASVNGGDFWAPVLMAGVAIPAYATPMLAMSQLGMMFQHGNSVGAAFVLLILGAGVNLGLLAWAYFALGLKKSLIWFTLLTGTALALGYVLEKPLYPTDIEPANHTHAFDIYCCPFGAEEKIHVDNIFQKLRDDIRPEEIFAIFALTGLLLLGIAANTLGKKFGLDLWLERQPEKGTGQSRYDLVLPEWAIATATVVGLLVLSGSLCYAYYPDPDECLAEIFIIKGEVLSAARSHDVEHALYWLPVWEDWNRRLQVGVYLRQGHLSEYHRMKSRIVRDQLELLEHALEDDKTEEVLKYSITLHQAQMRLTHAYLKE